MLAAAAAFAFSATLASAPHPPRADLPYGNRGDGIARLRIGTAEGASDAATAGSAMPDGRLVLGGVTGIANQPDTRQLAFARLTALGGSDPSFGPAGSGRIVLPLADVDTLVGVEATAGGPLLFLATTAQNTAVVGKLHENGGFVSSFGRNGLSALGPDLFFADATLFRPLRMVRLSDGGLLVIGSAMSSTSVCAAIARLTEGGSLDARFAGDGALCIAPPRDPSPYALGADAVELADGRLLVAGSAPHANGAGRDMFVARVGASGELDTTFGTDGNGFAFVGFDQGGSLDDSAQAIAVDARGRIVVAGGIASDAAANDQDIGVARLRDDGRIDSAFAVEGRYSLGDWPLGAGQQGASDVRILPGERILVGGWTQGQARVGIAVMLTEGGYQDEFFGESGIVRQAATTDPEDAVVAPAPHALLWSGDHLYFLGSIAVGPPAPDSAWRHAFAAARFVLPLFVDGFDTGIVD